MPPRHHPAGRPRRRRLGLDRVRRPQWPRPRRRHPRIDPRRRPRGVRAPRLSRQRRAARNLRRRHSNVISLLVQELANPCFVDIAVAARAAAEARGYEVNVVGAGASTPSCARWTACAATARTASSSPPAGTARVPRHSTLLRDLVARGLPAVVLLDRSPDPRVPAIRVDVETGALRGGRAPAAASAIAASRTWRCRAPVRSRPSRPRKAIATAATARALLDGRHRAGPGLAGARRRTRWPVATR